MFKNFKEKTTLKPDYGAESIYGGCLLGVRAPSGLAFYDWETMDLVRRIEIQPKSVYWSENGQLVCIATEDSYYVLKYDAGAYASCEARGEEKTEDGVESTFEVNLAPRFLGSISSSVFIITQLC